MDGRLRPFKKGFAHLAIATGLPVVPVLLHDAHRRWPNRTRRLIPGEFRVSVLPRVDTSSWRVETVEQHVMEIWKIFAEKLGPDQRPAATAS